MEISIIIDGVTDCLVDAITGELVNTEYVLVRRTITAAKAAKLQRNGWIFDWSIPHAHGCEIYELHIAGKPQVEGMIAFSHKRADHYTYVELVESAPHNMGKHKQYIGVGAHLFAIACKHSWDVGNAGYVQFESKTDLMQHYAEQLHAQCIGGNRMIIDTYGASYLINKYFKEV